VNEVAIVEMTNGVTMWRWLCPPCIAARRAAGWTVKAPAPLPDGLVCSDCEMVRQAAPGYVTPTVAFVPTTEVRQLPISTKKPKPATAPAGMFDESEAA